MGIVNRDWDVNIVGWGKECGGNKADIGILICCGLRQRFRDVKSM